MMISHSERVDAGEAPVRLLGRAMQAGVSRLEFHPVDRTVNPTAAVVADTGADAVEAEVRLADEAHVVDVGMELEARIEAARREASAEAREEWEEELERRVAMERVQVMKACEEFGRERGRYFAGVEAEVVKLALAIAARVLHREAKLDPLLLTGVVRVALDKVADDSATILRVPAAAVEIWREAFRSEAAVDVELVGDDRMKVGECLLETSVGKVELGVSAQLEEIEKGFFDLLQQRPA